MAQKSKISKFRDDIASDLRVIASALISNGVCGDPSPLHNAAADCQSRTDDCWGYNLTGLILRLGKLDKAYPTKQSHVSCKVDCLISSRLRSEPMYVDPLESLSINIRFDAVPAGGGDAFFQTWHLDREPGLLGNKSSDDVHPRYHIHFGGKGMTSSANDHRCTKHCHSFGSLLLLPSPRLLHPPLDSILAIDLILANSVGKLWKVLRSDASYSRIIQNSQARIWQPFARAFAEHWIPNQSISSRWVAKDACPQLV